MANNIYDPSFWSQPSSMQGAQSTSSQTSTSLPSFPFQSQFNLPSNTNVGGAPATSFPTYQAYVDAYRRSQPAMDNSYVGYGGTPNVSGPRLVMTPTGLQWTGLPVSQPQMQTAQAGQQQVKDITSGKNLSMTVNDPRLEQYSSRLSDILSNPGQIASDPNYQFIYNQGLGALGRQLGANRMQGSGAALLALQDYGQKTASQYLDTLANRYGGAITSELNTLQPKLRAAEDVFNAAWRNAPVSVSSGGSTSSSLGFGG